jgi:hypothetical protein
MAKTYYGFPVPLGVQLNCVPAREYTVRTYVYTVLPNSKLNSPETIFKAQPLHDEMYKATSGTRSTLSTLLRT